MTRAPDDDASALARLGYRQELQRAMGAFSSFAVSFSIISVLTGIVTTYADALASGGPAGLGIGWPLVSLGTGCVALAMAELASAFPTAGALYHWAALLGGPRAGWVTATMNLFGQFAITAAIDLGFARECAALIGGGDALVYGLLVAVVALHAAINVASVRLVARLNDFSATVHVLGVLVLVAALAVWGGTRPAAFLVEATFTRRSDGSTTLGFLGALILGMYTFTGYDASAHLSEETHDPARKAPKAILASVAVSAVAGYALLAALTLSIDDLDATAQDPHAALRVLRGALGEIGGRAAMVLALLAMWFCGLSSLTSASRTLYAFARDRGAPGHAQLRVVSSVTGTPVAAILAASSAALLVVFGLSPLAGGVFAAVVQVATMGVYVSYAIPIALGLAARRSGRWHRYGPFSLGRAGAPVAALALSWSAFVVLVCGLPPAMATWRLLVALLSTLVVASRFAHHIGYRGPPASLEQLQAEGDGGRASATPPVAP